MIAISFLLILKKVQWMPLPFLSATISKCSIYQWYGPVTADKQVEHNHTCITNNSNFTTVLISVKPKYIHNTLQAISLFGEADIFGFNLSGRHLNS